MYFHLNWCEGCLCLQYLCRSAWDAYFCWCMYKEHALYCFWTLFKSEASVWIVGTDTVRSRRTSQLFYSCRNFWLSDLIFTGSSCSFLHCLFYIPIDTDSYNRFTQLFDIFKKKTLQRNRYFFSLKLIWLLATVLNQIWNTFSPVSKSFTLC